MFQKLSPEQLQPIFVAFFQRLKPAVLSDCAANSNLIVGWLQSKNRAIDVQSLMEAASDLKNSLAWNVAPKKQTDVQMSKDSTRKNHAKPADDTFGESTIMRDAVAKMESEKVKPVIGECRSIAENHRSYPHSKTYRERAALQKTLSDLMSKHPNPTLKQAEAIRDALRTQRNGFPE